MQTFFSSFFFYFFYFFIFDMKVLERGWVEKYRVKRVHCRSQGDHTRSHLRYVRDDSIIEFVPATNRAPNYSPSRTISISEWKVTYRLPEFICISEAIHMYAWGKMHIKRDMSREGVGETFVVEDLGQFFTFHWLRHAAFVSISIDAGLLS